MYMDTNRGSKPNPRILEGFVDRGTDLSGCSGLPIDARGVLSSGTPTTD